MFEQHIWSNVVMGMDIERGLRLIMELHVNMECFGKIREPERIKVRGGREKKATASRR